MLIQVLLEQYETAKNFGSHLLTEVECSMTENPYDIAWDCVAVIVPTYVIEKVAVHGYEPPYDVGYVNMFCFKAIIKKRPDVELNDYFIYSMVIPFNLLDRMVLMTEQVAEELLTLERASATYQDNF